MRKACAAPATVSKCGRAILKPLCDHRMGRRRVMTCEPGYRPRDASGDSAAGGEAGIGATEVSRQSPFTTQACAEVRILKGDHEQ